MTTTLTLLGVILVIGAMAYRRASLFTATLATAAALVAGAVVVDRAAVDQQEALGMVEAAADGDVDRVGGVVAGDLAIGERQVRAVAGNAGT